MKISAAVLLLLAGCHGDWGDVLAECFDAGRCVHGGNGGGSGGAGGGSAVEGVKLTWFPVTGTAFATVEPGQTSRLELDLRNEGATRSARTRLAIDGGPFSSLNTCNAGNPLGSGEQCTSPIGVQFAPAAPGDFSTELYGAEDIDGGAFAKVVLSGRAAWSLVPFSIRVDGGSGAGQVSVLDGGTCPSGCDLTLPRTSVVTLTAAGVRSDFGGWSGACSGLDASCTVKLDGGETAIAAFKTWPLLRVELFPDTMMATDGVVRADGGGLTCSGYACSVGVLSGTSWQLFSEGTAFATFSQWETCGGGNGAAPNGVMTDAGACVRATFAPWNRMYVHDPVQMHDTNGLTHFDGLCNGVPGLPNANFKAWLRTGGNLSSEIVGAQGWVRMDGKPFLNLPTGTPGTDSTFYPPVIDRGGVDLGADAGPLTLATGALSNDCGGWTSATDMVGTGRATAGYSLWDNEGGSSTHSCGEALRYLCMQIDHHNLLPTRLPIPDGGRIAFVSAGQVTGSATRSAIDALCNSEWDGGRTFTALRNDGDGGSLASLVSLTGPGWYRTDGVQVLADTSQLSSTGRIRLLAPLNLNANGGLVGPGTSAWTGVYSPGTTTAISNETCDGWVGASGSGLQGDVTESSSRWLGNTTSGCNIPAQVYCFER